MQKPSTNSAAREEKMAINIDIRGLAPLLQVFDMPTSIKFYCDVLGFEIVANDKKTIRPMPPNETLAYSEEEIKALRAQGMIIGAPNTRDDTRV